jgi:hypothetical protein
MIKTKGSTDVTTYFKLVDPATGIPETGLTVTTLDMTYVRDRAAAVKNDVTALELVTSAHADNKMIEVDATNCPGLYRADWPDAAFAAGVGAVQLCINGAAIDPAYIEVELVDAVPTTTEFEARTIPSGDYLVAGDLAGLSTHSAADVKTAMEANGSKLDHLWEMTEDDGGTRRLTANALEEAPTSEGGGDATIENQKLILAGISAIVGWGTGAVAVNHDTGGAGVLAYKTDGDVGIDNAEIRAYLKADYDAGLRAASYVKGTTITDVNGEWAHDMMLDAETYTLVYHKQNAYGPDTKEVTVA